MMTTRAEILDAIERGRHRNTIIDSGILDDKPIFDDTTVHGCPDPLDFIDRTTPTGLHSASTLGRKHLFDDGIVRFIHSDAPWLEYSIPEVFFLIESPDGHFYDFVYELRDDDGIKFAKDFTMFKGVPAYVLSEKTGRAVADHLLMKMALDSI